MFVAVADSKYITTRPRRNQAKKQEQQENKKATK